MQEMHVQFPGQEDPLEEEWQPSLVFLPEKCHGERSLAGCSPWGRKESDSTERGLKLGRCPGVTCSALLPFVALATNNTECLFYLNESVTFPFFFPFLKFTYLFIVAVVGHFCCT